MNLNQSGADWSSKMALWWRALIPLCLINWLAFCCTSSAAPQKDQYKNSFRLTKSTRTRVQQLLKKYKEQQLGNQHYEDRGRQLRGLPVLSTDFQSWLNLTDWNRLHAAFWDMHAYWNMLDWKRQQLEKEDLASQAVQSTLPQSFEHIQLDLRDLMSQVSSQMSRVNSSWIRPTSPPAWTSPNLHMTSKRLWASRVEGYVILRDLDLYLTKLARDFLLLASKTHL